MNRGLQTGLTPARLVVTVALGGIFAMAAKPSVDPDTWWHLEAGVWMLEHGAILTHDAFSFTQAGAPWINHSWLSQLLLYLLWHGLGYAGLNLLVAVLVTAAFMLVYSQCAGTAYLKAFILVLAAAASAIYWSARPQLLSFFLAAMFAWVLARFRWQGENRLWLLPPLMMLWVNLHGGFALGFILLLITLAGQAASRLLGLHGPGMLERRGLVWLVGSLLACVAVVPLNPYGFTLYLYPLRTVSIGVLKEFIQEWQSPDFHQGSTQVFIVLWIVLLAALGASRRRMDMTDWLLLSGFTYLGLLSARNLPFVALLAPPVITRHLVEALDGLRATHPRLAAVLDPPPGGSSHPVLNTAFIGVLGLAVVAKVIDASSGRTNALYVAQQEPVEAVRFIQATQPRGPLFNAYNWGGYLVWTLYPQYPVFVDGRTDLYSDAFLRAYLATALARPGYRGQLDRYGINLVLVEQGSPLGDALGQATDWSRLYQDAQAVVYARNQAGEPNPVE